MQNDLKCLICFTANPLDLSGSSVSFQGTEDLWPSRIKEGKQPLDDDLQDGFYLGVQP